MLGRLGYLCAGGGKAIFVAAADLFMLPAPSRAPQTIGLLTWAHSVDSGVHDLESALTTNIGVIVDGKVVVGRRLRHRAGMQPCTGLAQPHNARATANPLAGLSGRRRGRWCRVRAPSSGRRSGPFDDLFDPQVTRMYHILTQRVGQKSRVHTPRVSRPHTTQQTQLATAFFFVTFTYVYDQIRSQSSPW